jgi:hypothetical protein
MRQQLGEAVDRMRGNPRQYIAEPGERLHGALLAGCDEAQQHRCRLAATIAAEVPTSHCHAPIRPLTGAVVNLQIAIGEKTASELLHGHSAALLRRDSFGPLVCFRLGRFRLNSSVAHDTTMQRRLVS